MAAVAPAAAVVLAVRSVVPGLGRHQQHGAGLVIVALLGLVLNRVRLANYNHRRGSRAADIDGDLGTGGSRAKGKSGPGQ